MPVSITCDGCGRTLNAPDKAAGKAVRCPGCGQAVPVPDVQAPGDDRSDADARVLVWTNPKSDGINIWGMTPEIVFVAVLRKRDLADAEARILDGDAPQAVVGDDGTCVPVSAIRRVEREDGGALMTIYHGRGSSPKRLLMPMADEMKAQLMLLNLQAAMGPGAKRGEEELTTWEAGKMPGIAAALAVLFTFLFTMAAGQVSADPSSIHATGRHAGKKKLFAALVGAIGPTGVLVLGLLATLGCIGWLVLRLRNRPLKQVLRRGRAG